MFFRKYQRFWGRKCLVQGGFVFLTFGFMPNAVPFEIPRHTFSIPCFGNCIHYKVRDKITYHLPNSGLTIHLGFDKFISHFTGLILLGLKLNLISKMGPRCMIFDSWQKFLQDTEYHLVYVFLENKKRICYKVAGIYHTAFSNANSIINWFYVDLNFTDLCFLLFQITISHCSFTGQYIIRTIDNVQISVIGGEGVKTNHRRGPFSD